MSIPDGYNTVPFSHTEIVEAIEALDAKLDIIDTVVDGIATAIGEMDTKLDTIITNTTT